MSADHLGDVRWQTVHDGVGQARSGQGALLFDRFWRKFTATVPEGRLWRVPFSPASPVTTPNTLDTGADGFARWNAAQGGYTEVGMGSSHIQAVGWDGSGCPVARTLLTYSESSNTASPHYSDQTELFSRGRMVKSRFRERDILASPQLKVVRVSER
ncbi:penicillin acylase family protein [Streptomyces sp. UNOB3_S3]|nr:penicillin acylase family protein [Streptomyces sp. UNOB3_S3]